MAGSWNLRQFFARKAIERERNAEQHVSSTEIIEVGDFRVEVAERVVTLRGAKLPLTAAEFDVLLYLIGHPQRCVTPRTVLATSWTSDGLHQTEFLKALLSLRAVRNSMQWSPATNTSEPNHGSSIDSSRALRSQSSSTIDRSKDSFLIPCQIFTNSLWTF